VRKYLPTILIVIGFLLTAWFTALFISGFGSRMFGEWKLVFHQIESTTRFLALFGGCGIAVTCIALLFRYEQQLISPLLGVVLLVLRLSLILVLFLTLLEPVWIWSFDEETKGRVVVAIDVSESMDTLDQHAPDVEKLRWAMAVGIVNPDADEGRAQRYLQALLKEETPDWVTEQEVPDPQRRHQLAKVREQTFRDQMDAVTQLSRRELCIRALTAHDGKLFTDLDDVAKAQYVLFASDFGDIDAQSLKSGPLDELTIDQSRSDMSQVLEASLAGENEGKLAAIVLISDGRDTTSKESREVLARLTGMNVPVHTILSGSDFRPRDLSVVDIEHPESVFEDDNISVQVQVQTSGFRDEEVTVLLEDVDDPDAEPLVETLTPTSDISDLKFTIDAMEKGRHRFRVRMDVVENETRDDNNEQEFSFSVVDDRAKVLLIDGEGRWEFRFLETALKRDERINVETVLFEQPYLKVLPKPFFTNNLNDFDKDEEKTPFAAFDMIIVGDVSSVQLPVLRRKQLETYVRDEGGTLVMTAGKRFMPLDYRSGAFENLLPIRNPRVLNLSGIAHAGTPTNRGFHLGITTDGDTQPMFQMDRDPDASKAIWASLPGHLWGIVGEAKGGANVWAAPQAAGIPNTLATEQKNGLIVQRYVGSGQVVWIGIDSTWRWRFRRGDEYHHRFWGQLARWAVAFKSQSGNQDVRIGLSESVIDEGTSTTIQTRWEDRFREKLADMNAEVVITSADEESDFSLTIPLNGKDESPLEQEAKLENLKSGEYHIRLKADGINWNDDVPQTTLIVNAILSRELQDVSADKTFLETAANNTGGQFMQLNELNRLPELFQDTNQVTAIHEEIPVWSHWLILVLFCLLATSEWVLRKLNGLP